MKKRLMGFLCVFLMGAPGRAQAQQGGIDAGKAREYFAEAEAICERDGGKLWGIQLCGPMIFVDPVTRTVVANQADKEGKLAEAGGVYRGTLPADAVIANTATEWSGVKWTMVMWPLPEREMARARLMLHEQFHRVQAEVGLPGGNPGNAHLDTKEARVWLELEWRALGAALVAEGQGRRVGVADAAVFRAMRQGASATAASEERALEMSEGVAEYTGVKLRGSAEEETRRYMAQRLREAEDEESVSRSFAYESGPAYGLLLDASGAEWRVGLTPASDLGTLLTQAMGIPLPVDLQIAAEVAEKRHEGAMLRAKEEERAKARARVVAEYRAALVDGPVLIFPPGAKFNFSYDPYGLANLEGVGTVYRRLRVTDEWGVLDVRKGGLIKRSEKMITGVTVPAPANTTGKRIEGDGWTLQLAEGWELAKGAREGDWEVKRQEAGIKKRNEELR